MLLCEDKRINKYKKLIEVYDLFNLELYNDAIRVLGTILESIIADYELDFPSNDGWARNYFARIMEYRRPLRKSKLPMIRQFNQFFHIAMMHTTNWRDKHAYSYLFDMKTILERLNDTTRV